MLGAFVAVVSLSLMASFPQVDSPPQVEAHAEDERVVLVEGPDLRIAQDGRWVRYEHLQELASVETLTYYGESTDDGGCIYSGEDVVQPTGKVILEEREIAQDHANCIMVTEIGEPSDERAAELRQEVLDDVSEVGSGDNFAPLAEKTAWQKTVHRDPLLLEVSGSRVSLRFNYNGSCATRLGYGVTLIRLAATGWVLNSSTTSRQDLCSEVHVQNHSSFMNAGFCYALIGVHSGTVTTYMNRVRGLPNGYVGYNWTTSKSGLCSYLLHFHRPMSH